MTFGIIDQSLQNRQRLFFPHFASGKIPLEPVANVAYRRRMYLTSDKKLQRLIKKMCSEDFLFWLYTFGYLFDAGDESGKPGPVPFAHMEFQVELLTGLWACLHEDRCSARVKKPRKLGLTWMLIALFAHAWQFRRDCHLLIGSHREEEVDGSVTISKGGIWSGEWSKLLPKMDFIHLHQPRWLLPQGYTPRQEPCRTRLKIVNPENGSIVWGTSAASRAGHGSRGYAAAWDEAAHVETLFDILGGLSEFAPCKIYISTIDDLGHPFSTILRNAPGIVQYNPEWWMHPDYSKNMTISTNGERMSPWLRKKLDEIGNDPIIANRQYYAREDMQIGGYYHPKTFEIMLGNLRQGSLYGKPPTVMDPFWSGELDIIDTKEGPRVSRFCDQVNGRWKLWFNFDASGRPPRGTRYIQGADIAAGTVDSGGRGASNSVLAFVDWMTGELVAEFVADGVPPQDLARIACAAGFWFEGDDFMAARTTFERNGPFGAAFGTVLSETYRYPNIWRAPDAKMGWHKGAEAQPAFALHQLMICDGRFKERSKKCVDEMTCYQNPSSGKGAPVHTAALYSEDPSGARDNHGDRVITRIVICQVLEHPYEVHQKKGEAPWGSARMLSERLRKDRWAKQLA